MNQVNFDSTLWIYAIHSKNAELIHILESINLKTNKKTYEESYRELIKCHHNEFANYNLNYSSLTQITIPSFVTSIGNCAFFRCSSLAQITIPSSATFIGNCAFSRCSSLSHITNHSKIDFDSLDIPPKAIIFNSH